MLNKKITREVVREVRDVITNRGKCLEIKAGSPVEDLVGCTMKWMPANLMSSVYVALPAALEAAQLPKVNEEHAKLQEAVAVDLANRMSAAAGYIKGTVIDNIVECKEYVEEYADTVPPLHDIRIIQRTVPEIMYDIALPYKTISVPVRVLDRIRISAPYSLQHNLLPTDETATSTWLENADTSTYWSIIFTDATDGSKLRNYWRTLPIYDRIDFGLVMILGADVLMRNPELSKADISLTTLRSSLASVRSMGTGLLQRTLGLLGKMAKLGRLVITEDEKSITVETNAYQQYLEDGGTADAVIGRCIANDNVNRGSHILSNVIEYTAIGNGHIARANAMHRKDKLRYTKEALREYVGTFGRTFVPSHQMDINYGVGCAYKCINSLQSCDVIDLYACAKIIVAKHLFYYTNAFQYLTYMDAALKDNDKLTPEECSMVANMEILCDFAASHLTLAEY